MESMYYYYLAFLPFIFMLYKILFHDKKNLPPSPFALPIIGHLHKLKKPLPLALQEFSSQYGPILSLKLGSRSVLVVSSPSAVKECFAKNDLIFANRPKSIAADYFTYNYNNYAWAPYGDLWKSRRRLTVVELFSSNSVQNNSFIREQEVHRLLRRLYNGSAVAGGNKKVDLKFLFTLLLSNLMMRLAVGKCCVEKEIEDTELEKHVLQELKDKFFPSLTLNVCDFVPFLRMIGYKGIERRIIKMQKDRDEYLQNLIDEIRLKRLNCKVACYGEENRSLTETLLDLEELNPGAYTDEVIKGIIQILFNAGVDTSASTLEWAMSLLLIHPEIMQKLKAEIDKCVGHGHLINDADLVKLPYLKCVVNETMRLYPSAPIVLPHLSSEVCSVGGFEIPKNTTLIVNILAMNRNPNVWEDPLEFKPERFEGEQHEFKFIPFGMGRRACPGAGMSTRMISMALGGLIQGFEWENDGMEEVDMSQRFALSLYKAKPLAALCSPRTEMVELLSQL